MPTRVETPSLNDMRAKQGALVSRFMTFFQRKFSMVVEMYEASFYRKKPDWDRIAEFIYKDLCGTPELRKEVLDVQFHPVKMLLFIKFSEEKWRDILVAKVQSAEGVVWSEYGVKVKGYSLDAQVKFIRLLGVSPETVEEDIKKTFQELGIGEVIESKKGVLDSKRLPWVTNGTWALRVKILDSEKIIPSYIHRRDEGELWSLNFEGRVFCCWKCGNGNHIGDKCRDQTRTFEEVFNGSVTDEDFVKPSWAAVVRSGQGENTEQSQRIKDMEAKLKEENKLRDKEKKDHEERERLKEVERERVIEEAAENARQLKESKSDVNGSNDTDFEDDGVNTLLANIVDPEPVAKGDCSSVDPEAEAADKTLLTAIKHKSWLESRAVGNLIAGGLNLVVPQDVQELERIFGPGAAQHQLAIEYQGKGEEQPGGSNDSLSDESEGMDMDDDDNSEISDSDQSQVRKTSTPNRRKRGKKRIKEPGLDSSGSLSPVVGGGADPQESKDKKLRFDGGEKLPGEGVLGMKPQGVHGVQQHELSDQQHGAHQPGAHQLGEHQLGEQKQGDFLLEEQHQTNYCDAGHENSPEVTVGEVLPATLPGSTEPGGGGDGGV